jgi:hypothetical protein
MKIALCLHGYYANAGGAKASDEAISYITRKVLEKGDVDIFVHSWDLDNKEKIETTYAPVISQYEKQKDFKEELKRFDENWFNSGFDRESTMYRTNTIFRGLSFLYSRMRSIEIKKQHEEENGFRYDCVVAARFDLGTRGKEHPQKYYATDMNFNPALDMDYMYSAFWNQTNHGYADHWFYSNSENMDTVGALYHGVTEYYQVDSEYTKAVTTGWPESNAEDEFSNECFLEKNQRASKLQSFPRWGCIDNHKLYKWHLIQTGLHAKSRLIDITRDL